MAAFPVQLDRARRTPLAAQIYSAVREGIENASAAFLGLFKGENLGKMLVRLS